MGTQTQSAAAEESVPSVAMQPILGADEQVFGYELLFRQSAQEQPLPQNAQRETCAIVDTTFGWGSENSEKFSAQGYKYLDRVGVLGCLDQRGFGAGSRYSIHRKGCPDGAVHRYIVSGVAFRSG